ncbi:MAG: hypothetical protein JO061_14850, partial [Acidobacteriaceae bacterium]|nr:hypothetical protein [Acidobacteriaceae bacterium]
MKFLLASALVVCAPFAYCTSFSNGQAARAVIGQYEFTQNNAAANSQIVGGVSGLAYDGSGLWVADGDVIGALVNNRVLRFAITGQLQVPHADLSVVGSPTADNSCVLCGYVADVVLGQVDFVSVTAGTAATASSSTAGSMSNPTAVASDGVHLAVVDTGNNRILIWNSLPLASNTPPNVVLGQRDFTTVQPLTSVNASSLRAPQGIWIEGGKLFVADTGNDRVLIWNSIPSTNNQPADLVLGQPNFSTVNAPPLSSTAPTAAANQLWNPISVTVSADGTHLLVADFGFNRVLIWNSIPSSNQQAADVVVGQPDMASSQANNASAECASNGKDSNGNPTYPLRCETTVDHPRFALFNGTQLFIADTGNDRVLVYNELPSSNKTAADFVLGQPDFQSDVVTGQASSAFSTILNNAGSTDTIPTPMALAWDGTNLYVSDPTDRRVMIFTPGDTVLPQKSVLNNASKITRQEGFVTVSGTPVANDTVTITIAGTNYTYTIAKNDTLTSVVNGLISKINSGSGDPNAQALTGNAADTVYLDSKGTNNDLNTIAFSASSSNTSDITVTTSGSYLTGGNSGTAAPGTLVEIDDPSNSLADFTTSASPTQGFPGILKDPNHPGSTVQVFMDGLSAPLMYASPGQVIAQVPYFVDPNSHQPDRDSISVYVRTVHANGNITVTNAQPVVVAAAVPGLFGAPTQNEPRPAFGALHQAGNPSATISIDGSAQAGDVITITVSGTNYTYTVLSSDSLASIVSALVT